MLANMALLKTGESEGGGSKPKEGKGELVSWWKIESGDEGVYLLYFKPDEGGFH